jgi:hypothetical protein
MKFSANRLRKNDLPSSVTTETEILESQKHRMFGANKSIERKHKSQKPSKVNFT